MLLGSGRILSIKAGLQPSAPKLRAASFRSSCWSREAQRCLGSVQIASQLAQAVCNLHTFKLQDLHVHLDNELVSNPYASLGNAQADSESIDTETEAQEVEMNKYIAYRTDE